MFVRTSYVYDDQCRVSEKHNDVGPSDNRITKITYSDQGDEAEEILTTSHPPHSPEENVVNFSYQYDSFGSWVEKVVTSPSGANEAPKTWSITRRTITYY